VIGAGGLLGLQGRVNGELGRRIGSPLDAALVSFAVGLALLAGYVALRERRRLAALRRAPIRPWWLLSGLGGAAVVSTTAAGVPKVGVALVSVCIVAGTAVGALAVDELGLGPAGRAPLTPLRAAGAGLAVAAVGLGAVGDAHAAIRPVLFAALFAAGAASAAQQAANGQLRGATGSVAVASLISFLGGTLVLLAATAARGEVARPLPGTWWLYVGGVCGVVYIALAAATVAELGVLRLSLATVAGQLLAAVVLDLAWPAPGTRLAPTTVAGAVLTLAAVGLVGRRRARPVVPAPLSSPDAARNHAERP
jgi:transporter family-2 protein